MQFDTYKPNLKNTHFDNITCYIKIVVVYVPFSSSSIVVELSVDSFTSDFPFDAIDRAIRFKKR